MVVCIIWPVKIASCTLNAPGIMLSGCKKTAALIVYKFRVGQVRYCPLLVITILLLFHSVYREGFQAASLPL